MGRKGEVKTALINEPRKQWGALLVSVPRAFQEHLAGDLGSLAGISFAEGLHTLEGRQDRSPFTDEGSESEDKRLALAHGSVGAGSVPSSRLGFI